MRTGRWYHQRSQAPSSPPRERLAPVGWGNLGRRGSPFLEDGIVGHSWRLSVAGSTHPLSSPVLTPRQDGDGLSHRELIIGLDVGSTAVKYVVVAPNSKEILCADYRLHETRQPEKVLEV